MVVDARRQVEHLDPRRKDAVLPRLVRELHDRIGVGHVQVAADQRHAERRVQALQESRPGFGHPVAVGVAQQRNAVGTRRACAGSAHDESHDPTTHATRNDTVVGRFVALGHEDVTVGQRVEPARMVQVARHGSHREPERCGWSQACRPTRRSRHVDRRDRVFYRGRQLRRDADARAFGHARGFAAARQEGQQCHQHGSVTNLGELQKTAVHGGFLDGYPVDRDPLPEPGQSLSVCTPCGQRLCPTGTRVAAATPLALRIFPMSLACRHLPPCHRERGQACGIASGKSKKPKLI